MSIISDHLHQTVIDPLEKEREELYDFIERIESTTFDKHTQKKIREFLIKKGRWK